MSNVIMTSNGSYFPFENPESHKFDIDEIAHALSHLCRYTGHVNQFYSVAQHSVLVSRMVPPAHALAALLHDASEAYLGDVSSPLKRLLPDYKAIEERVERAIFKHFGLPFPLHESVKEADMRMLLTERQTLLPPDLPGENRWPAFEPYDFHVVPLAPVRARALFKQRYAELTDSGLVPRFVNLGDVAEPGDLYVGRNGERFIAKASGPCTGCVADDPDEDIRCPDLPKCTGVSGSRSNTQVIWLRMKD